MKLDLTKQELITLVKGERNGSYQLAEFLIRVNLGNFVGAPNEHWQWNDTELNKLSENGLIELRDRIRYWKDVPIDSNSQKIDRSYVEYLQKQYFERTGIWLPVDNKYIKQ